MEMRMTTLLPVFAVIGALSFTSAASAQQSGNADQAKALLAKAATAVKADEAGALARFDDPNGSFKDHDPQRVLFRPQVRYRACRPPDGGG